ncbi:regulatory protein RecX [Knoellia sp. CPCC 206435]|uniref:regulatory protein RecX n=1 Tax=Knoellia terrae TaxID=3404797 RepID=UPI003B43BC0B
MTFADAQTPPPPWAAASAGPRAGASPAAVGAVEPGSDGAAARPQWPPSSSSPAAEEQRRGRSRDARRASRDGGSRRGRGSTPPPEDPATAGSEPDAHDVARQIVLRQLTNSPKSRAQLAQALARRDCDPDVAQAVLDRMEDVGLVDDEAYAGMLVRSQQAGRGLARRALAQTLRQKGVSDEVAEAALDEVDPADEEERARALVEKRLRRLHGLEATVQTRRLAGMLARKGYPSDLSLRLIREAIVSASEHQRD